VRLYLIKNGLIEGRFLCSILSKPAIYEVFLCGFEAELKIPCNYLVFRDHKALKHIYLLGFSSLFSYLIYVVKQRNYER
jgi:hypothetical protein